jgi:hypothetical protein
MSPYTELLSLIQDLEEALDNVLLHQGKYMSSYDYDQRSALVLRAQALLDSHNG